MARFINGRVLFLVFLIIVESAASAQVRTSSSKIRINNLPEPKDTASIILISPDMTEDRTWITTETSFSLAGQVESKKDGYQVLVNGIPIDLKNNFFHTTLEVPYGTGTIIVALNHKGEQIKEYYYNIYVTEPVETVAGGITRPGKYYALIIGIDSYPDMGENLDNAVKDATAVYNLLVERYSFERSNVRLLIDPDRAQLIDEFDRLATTIGPNDNLLIFYAGHGFWDEKTEIGYWLPSDARLNSKAAWFQNSSLVSYLGAIKSKHTLLISDACFSGSIFKTRSISDRIPDKFEEIYNLPSRKAITSGTLSEVPDESIFIKYLLDRLRTNTDTYLSSETLFSRLREPVENNSISRPRMGVVQGVGDEGGDFIFILRNR